MKRYRMCMTLIAALFFTGAALAQVTLFYDDMEGTASKWQVFNKGEKPNDLRWSIVYDQDRMSNVLEIDATSIAYGIRSDGLSGKVTDQLVLSFDVKATSKLGFVIGLKCHDDVNGTFWVEYNSGNGKHSVKDDKITLYLGAATKYKNKNQEWFNILQSVSEDIITVKDNIYTIHSIEYIYLCGDVRADNVQLFDAASGVFETLALEGGEMGSSYVVSSLRVGLPSPTAASLGKFGDIPVSLYTGIPDITIPLYEVKGRNLSIPISLQYHASGVKVEEIPGWVGLGWALNAGGVITRTVKGLPDDDPFGFSHTGYKLLDDDIWSDSVDEDKFYDYVHKVEMEDADSKPDMFYFNFAGRSGKFVFGEDGMPYTIPYQKIKMEKEESYDGYTNYYSIVKWTMTTEDGTRYIFNAREYTTETVLTESGAIPTPMRYISSWYLTEIIPPTGDDVITLSYTNTDTVTHESRFYQEEYHVLWAEGTGGCSKSPRESINRYETIPVRLQSITSAFGRVDFETSLREDARHPDPRTNPNILAHNRQEHKLDKMKIYGANGEQQKEYVFQYGYYNNSSTQYGYKRLRLDEIWEQTPSGARLPSYKFSYNTTTLPSRYSNAIDHWGYYNGKDDNDTFIPFLYLQGPPPYPDLPDPYYVEGADRRPDPTKSMAGILTKIVYPTGGSTEFTYEAHDYGYIGSDPVTKELVFKDRDSGPLTAARNETTELDFTIEGSNSVIVVAYVLIDFAVANSCFAFNPLGGFIQIWQGSNKIDCFEMSGEYTFLLSPGTYELVAFGGTKVGAEAQAHLWWKEVEEVSTKLINGGGVRIKRIETYDGINTANNTVREYEYRFPWETDRSSGSLVREPQYCCVGTIGRGKTACSCISMGVLSVSAVSLAPLSMTQGSYIGYEVVKEIYGENGAGGYSVKNFSSPIVFPDWRFDQDTWPFGERISQDWKRGQLLRDDYYNKDNILQKTVQYEYDYSRDDEETTKIIRAVSFKKETPDNCSDDLSYVIYEIPPWINRYYHTSKWLPLKKEVVTSYDQNGQNPVISTKKYDYENANHVQLTRIEETNTDGKKRITKMTYPADYAGGSGDSASVAITAMKNAKHMHNAVIERVILEDNAGSKHVVSGELVKYKQLATGQVLPSYYLKLNSPAPMDSASFTFSDVVSGYFDHDPAYAVQQTLQTYDTYGNLTKGQDGLGNTIRYFYGTNDQPFTYATGDMAGVYLTGIQRVQDAIDTNLPSTPGDRPAGNDDLFISAQYNAKWNAVSKLFDENGNATSFLYDPFGRLEYVKNHADQTLTSYSYYYSLDNHTAFDPAFPNAIQTTAYTGTNNLISKTYFDGLGREIQTQVQDGTNDIVTAKTYNPRGLEYKMWKPFTQNTGHAFDTSYETHASAYYDGDPGAACGGYAYTENEYYADPLNRIKKIGNPGTNFRIGSGHEIEQAYDLNAGTISIGPSYSFAAHTLTKTVTTNEDDQVTEVYQDMFGNKVFEVTDPSGLNLRTGYKYDILGNLLTVFPPNYYTTQSTDWVTTYTYNTLGQMLSKTSPDAGLVKSKYDAAGNLRFVQDAKHAAGGDDLVFYLYDDHNRLLVTGEATSEAAIPSWSALDGNQSYTTAPENFEAITDNYKVVNAYDQEPTYGSGVWASAADPGTLNNLKGKLAAAAYRDEVSGAWGYTFYSYDNLGNIATLYQDLPGSDLGVKTIAYEYDLQNNIVRIKYQDGSSDAMYEWRKYDEVGRLWIVKASPTDNEASANTIVSYTYWPTGQIKQATYPNNRTVDYTLTVRDWIDKIEEPNLFLHDLAYDNVGNVANINQKMDTDRDGTITDETQYGYNFGYDAANRLTSATATASPAVSVGYSYFPNGNIQGLVRGSANPPAQNYWYYANTNRLQYLTGQNTQNYQYDANGNVTKDLSKGISSDILYDYRNLPYKIQFEP